MSETLKELRKLSEKDLIKKHDKLAESTQVGTKHYLTEIARRDQDKQTKAIKKLTCWITIMTLIMMIATIINTLIIMKVIQL